MEFFTDAEAVDKINANQPVSIFFVILDLIHHHWLKYMESSYSNY